MRKLSAWLKPRIPAALWPVLLTTRSIGKEVRIGLPRFRRVLVLAPHPDDETLGCGGTIAQLADAGCRVVVAVVTDGEATKGSPASGADTAARRREEAVAACRILGTDGRPRFLGLPDGAVADRAAELTTAVRGLLAEVAPDAVFVPWFLDGHPDHRAVSDAVLAAAPDDLELWGYETHTALVPNRLVDISPTLDRKQRAIAAHATAGLAFELDTALGLNRWRSIHGLMGRGHAEAFLVLPAAELRRLSG